MSKLGVYSDNCYRSEVAFDLLLIVYIVNLLSPITYRDEQYNFHMTLRHF